MIVELPWPSSDLNAHISGFRGGQWKKINATKKARADGHVIGLSHQKEKILGPVEVEITFVLPNRIRRDIMNLATSIKGYIDGLVDAGIIEDDNYTILKRVFLDSRLADKGEKPKVLVTILPLG